MIEDLLTLGQELVSTYLTVDASGMAREGFEGHHFPIGDPWPRSRADDAMEVDDDPDELPPGDAVLRQRHG